MPPHGDRPGRAPVTAADVSLAVRLAVAALGRAPAEAWGNQAGALEWDCWETVEHIADVLFAYATQLTPATPARGCSAGSSRALQRMPSRGRRCCGPPAALTCRTGLGWASGAGTPNHA